MWRALWQMGFEFRLLELLQVGRMTLDMTVFKRSDSARENKLCRNCLRAVPSAEMHIDVDSATNLITPSYILKLSLPMQKPSALASWMFRTPKGDGSVR